MKHRWNEPVVEHHAVVRASFHDVRQRQTRIGIGDFTGQQQARPERANLDDRRIARRRCCVARLDLAYVVTHQAIGPSGAIGLERTPPAAAAVSLEAAELLGLLAEAPRGADELARACGRSSAEVASVLVELELEGLVAGADGVYRCRPDRPVLAR